MKIFQTDNVVILSFLPFAGGKFLSNCLSLSKHACPQDPVAANHLLSYPEDYDFRLQTVLRTLPPMDQLKDWRNFEFGDYQLFGHGVDAWRTGIPQTPNDITQRLCQSKMKFFMINHTMNPHGLLSVWPNSTILRLINFRQFQALSIARKSSTIPEDISAVNGNYCAEKYELLRGNDWPSWQEFESKGYDITKFTGLDTAIIEEISTFYHLNQVENQVLLFDVDRCYFDQSQFIAAMQDLYNALKLSDFQLDLIELFYKKYMALHIR